MPESDPLRHVREKLLAEADESVELSLSAGEAEALTKALERAERYPSIHGAWLHGCAELRRVETVRLEFQRVQGGKVEKRALDAVDALGWRVPGEGVRRRGHTLLFHYRMLVTGEGTSEGICHLIAPPGVHPEFAPRRDFVVIHGVPLNGDAAIDVLAEWYGATHETMRKWLKDAKATATEELGQADDLRARHLRRLLAAKLPESADTHR